MHNHYLYSFVHDVGPPSSGIETCPIISNIYITLMPQLKDPTLNRSCNGFLNLNIVLSKKHHIVKSEVYSESGDGSIWRCVRHKLYR